MFRTGSILVCLLLSEIRASSGYLRQGALLALVLDNEIKAEFLLDLPAL